MSVPRSAHYVPRFFLGGFCDPTRAAPTLWVYERNKPVRKSTPFREAKQRDYYALKRGRDQECAIEQWLSKVEAKAASILSGMRGKSWGLRQPQKAELAIFIAQMFNRTPAGREFVNNSTEALRKILQDPERKSQPAFLALHDSIRQATGVRLTPDELLSLLTHEREMDQFARRRRELFMLVRMTPIFANAFLKFSWQIWEVDGDQMFLTSDAPVITLCPRNDGVAELGVGLLAPGTRVYFPLTAQMCLVMLQDGPEGRRTIPANLTRMINRAVLSCAKRFIYGPTRSGALAELFTRVGCRLEYGVNCFNRVEISTS